MNDITKETRGNPKLVWAFGCLIAAAAALSLNTEMTHKSQKAKDDSPQAYLKNCALKTALERPQR